MSQADPGRGSANRFESARSRRSAGAGDGPPSKRLGAYLRRLREGYGYTLRKVEERALAIGESIDNSQLSRFEKGKAVPSFEKLRALARIFNVSVQNFSDVLDLEEYEPYKPTTTDYQELLRTGAELLARGEHGRAFVTYERALEVAESDGDGAAAVERAAEARWRMAAALKAMGKLSITEAELRAILKHRKQLGRRTRMKALLELSYVYRQFGDFYLASVFARECLELAAHEGDLRTQAGVLNNLGSVYHDEGDPEQALGYFQRALETLERLGGHEELWVVALANLGGCLVSAHRFEEGVTKLREAHAIARERGFRRATALSLNRLAEAYFHRGDYETARGYLVDSDALSSRAEESYHDILFMNAYIRWKMAVEEHNGTREKIAFGRLRHLRSLIERKFPEVQEFDEYVERTRRKHV